ncbi:hypothetical protein CC2G_014417 [Coprinopsis cinerea AmutBmut pab1-1]|nr:hypothetical protein CC2G_014417 [Coprinopsis cinerea AmutBmut pab1-1]
MPAKQDRVLKLVRIHLSHIDIFKLDHTSLSSTTRRRAKVHTPKLASVNDRPQLHLPTAFLVGRHPAWASTWTASIDTRSTTTRPWS